MQKILAILMLLMLNLNIALAQNLEIDETNLSEKIFNIYLHGHRLLYIMINLAY